MPNEIHNGELRALPNVPAYISLVPAFADDPSDDLSIKDFIRSIERIAKLGNWGPAEKLQVARCKVRGEVARFISKNSILDETEDYELFKNTLLEVYTPKEAETTGLERFLACRQAPNETISRFAARLQSAAQALPEAVRQDFLLTQFLAGMLPDIMRFVKTHNPKTFDAAKEQALLDEKSMPSQISVQAAEYQRIHRSEGSNSSTDVTRLLFEEIKKLNERIDQLSTSNREQRQPRHQINRPNQIICFYCNRPGHISTNCFRRARNNDRNSRGRYAQPRQSRNSYQQHHEASEGQTHQEN